MKQNKGIIMYIKAAIESGLLGFVVALVLGTALIKLRAALEQRQLVVAVPGEARQRKAIEQPSFVNLDKWHEAQREAVEEAAQGDGKPPHPHRLLWSAAGGGMLDINGYEEEVLRARDPMCMSAITLNKLYPVLSDQLQLRVVEVLLNERGLSPGETTYYNQGYDRGGFFLDPQPGSRYGPEF